MHPLLRWISAAVLVALAVSGCASATDVLPETDVVQAQVAPTATAEATAAPTKPPKQPQATVQPAPTVSSATAFSEPAVVSTFAATLIEGVAPVDHASFESVFVPLVPGVQPVDAVPHPSGDLWVTELTDGPTICEGFHETVLRLLDPGTGEVRDADYADASQAALRNVVAVEPGPENQMAFLEHCGEVVSLSLATMTPNGAIADVRSVQLPYVRANSGYMQWYWGRSDSYGPGLYLRMPLMPVVAPAAPSWTHVWIHASTGDVVGQEPGYLFERSGYNAAVRVNADRSVGLGESIVIADPSYSRSIADRPFRLDPSVLIGDESGVRLVSSGAPGAAVEPVDRLTDEAVRDVAWSPLGEVPAWSGPSGTWIDGKKALDTGGTLEFTSDGSALIVTSADGWHVMTFEPAAPPDDTNGVTPWSQLDNGGLGPIRVGMTVTELSTALGRDLTIDSIDDPDPVGTCVWIADLDIPGVWLLGESLGPGDATIRVVYASLPWRTPSGLHVGVSEQAVRDALGDQIRSQPHVYRPGGLYMNFEPASDDDPNNVQFVSHNGIVYEIKVGDRAWTPAIEGCA